jgi:hypothetical protein
MQTEDILDWIPRFDNVEHALKHNQANQSTNIPKVTCPKSWG